MSTNARTHKILRTISLLSTMLLLAGGLAAQNLQLSFNSQPPTCTGYTNGTATVTATGGSGQYAYSWSNGQSGQTNFGLGAGNYTITVTDLSGGATTTGSFAMPEPAAIQIQVTSSGLDCSGTTGTLTASGSGGTGAIGYLWSTGSSSAATPVSMPGNYFVTATDANGCAAVTSTSVIAPLSLSTNVVNIPCSYLPQGGSIGVAVSGGMAPHSYRWSNGSTNAVILNQSAGTYTVTVTDTRGCTATATGTLTLPTPILVDIVSITPACGGNNGSATVNASGGTPPYRYVWGNGTLGPTATNLAPGQYYVCTFDANNCQHDTWIIIPGAGSLNVTLTPTNPDCNALNGSATVTVNPANGNYTYTWNIPNTPNTATSVSGIPAGTTVLVTVTESSTGCQGTASVTLDAQNNLSVNITDTDIPCAGQNNGSAAALVTGGSGTITYTWTYPDNTSFTGQQISSLAPGIYQLLVRDSRGCTATANTEITVNADVNLQVAQTEVRTCQQEATLTATASSNATLVWLDADGNEIGTGPSITVPAGTDTASYKVVASDGSGCSAEKIIKVMPNTLDLSFAVNNPSQGCAGVPVTWGVTTTSPVSDISYTWTAPGGVTITPANSANPVINAPSGSYDITVTASTPDGCTASMTAPLRVSEKPEISVDNNNITSCSTLVTIHAIVVGTSNIQWFDSNNNSIGSGPSITVPAGSYTVVASNAQDCSDREILNVSSNATDINLANTNPAQACTGANLNWAVINTDPKDTLTYSWTAPAGVTVTPNNSATPVINGNNGGLYAVSVTATNQFGCSTTLSAPLNVTARPEVTVDKSEIIACETQTTLGAAVTNATQIIWSDATGNPIGTGASITFPTGNAPATYTVTASNGPGCSDTASILVAPHPVEVNFAVNNAQQLCEEQSTNWSTVNLNPNDQLSFQWTTPANVTATPANGANPLISTTAPGNYTLTVTATNQFGCTATLTAPLKILEKPELTLNSTSVTACDNTVTLSANATGAPQIVWTNPAGAVVGNGTSVTLPTGTTPTVYTVTASNAAGCSDTDNVRVTPNPVDLNFGTHTQQLCESNTATWTVVNQDSRDTLFYQWTAPTGVQVTPATGTTPVLTALSAGTYTITVTATNQFGCTKTLTDVLTVQARQSLSGKMAIDLCQGRLVGFDNTTSFPGTWTFGDGQSTTGTDVSHQYANPGTYQVNFTPSDNCVKPFDTTIVVQPSAAIQAAFANNLQNCVGQALIQFTDQSQYSAPIQSWNWLFQPGGQSSNQQNPAVGFSTEGAITATLVVKDNNGCTDTATVELKADIVNESINPNFEFCPGGSVALNPDFNAGAGYNYLWTSNPPDPKLNAGSGNPQVAPTVPTTYTVEVRKGDCKATFEAAVKPLEALKFSASEDQTVCNNTPVNVSAQGPAGANYTWSASPNFNPVLATGSTLTVVPDGKQTFYVRAEKSGECPGVDSVVVANAKVQVEALGPSPRICKGSEAELVVRNMNPDDVLTYNWSSGAASVSTLVVQPEVNSAYSVTVANQAGCTASLSFNVAVIDVKVTADIIGKDTICFGESAQLMATATGGTQYTYSWEPGGTLTATNIPDPKANPETTTVYTVTVMADDLCPDTANVTVYFVAQQCIEPYIFVPKAFTPNGDQNNDYFRVRGNNITEMYLVVWNRWGEKVFETTDLESPGWDGSFNGKESTPDSYAWLVRVRCGNGAFWTKKGDVTLLK